MSLLNYSEMRYGGKSGIAKEARKLIEEEAKLEENKILASVLEDYDIDKDMLYRKSQQWRTSLEEDTTDLVLKVMKENLAKLYVRSLPINEEYKSSHTHALAESFKIEFNRIVSDEALLEACEKNSFLKEFKKVCESQADNIVDILLSEAFEREPSSREMIIKENSFVIDLQMASDVIKDKVRWVVNEEKSFREMENNIKTVITESSHMIGIPPLLHRNIFDSMMMESYQEQYYDNSLDKETVDFTDMLNEAIMNYSLLETINTLNIKKFTKDEIANKCMEYKM